MNVVLLTPALTGGDAVSNDVLGMCSTLKAQGHNVAMSVRWGRENYPVVPISQIPALLPNPEDLLIYHHSIGFEEGVQIVEKLPCRKMVKYHNVTPPEFFRALSRDIARGCAEGKKQVERLARPDVLMCADSPFNAREVHAFRPGCPVEILPPFNQVEKILQAEPDITSVGLYDDWHTNILMIGRLVPNKNIPLGIEAFAEYRQKFDRHSRLILIGDLAQNTYCNDVLGRIRELGIGRQVIITGKVTVEQMKAFFLTAQMLLTTSLHEGFCLPLIEAMGLRVPIVAVPLTAIPDTAGDVAWYAEPNAMKLAEVMNQVRHQPEERERRMIAGWERYQGLFRNEEIEARFLELVEMVCEADVHRLPSERS